MSTQTLGHYEIKHLLGEGGIGRVYAALDQELGRMVAIKALRPEFSNDKSFVERFRGEAASLARLTHANITTLYSLHRDDKQVYMVMELVSGRTLEDVLERAPRLPPRDCLALVAQAAAGLGYAHRMGVIHRDIKPANLMLTESGVLKIMDFGIARIRGSQRMTRAGNIIGTPAYMPPEQIRGEECDERSDIYSLGCVLYEMLSGAPPFHADSEYDLIRAQVETQPRALRPQLPDLDPHIESALLKALAKAPAQRFESADQFSQALGAAAIERESIDILRQRYAADVARMPPKPVADSPLPGISTGGDQRHPQPEPRRDSRKSAAPPGPSRPVRWDIVALGGVAAALAAGFAFVFLGTAPSPPPAPEPINQPISLDGGSSGSSSPAKPAVPSSSNFFPSPDADRPHAAVQAPCPPGPDGRAATMVAGRIADYSDQGWPQIGGHVVSLFGIKKIDASQRAGIADWLDANGGDLTCCPRGDGSFQCKTANLQKDVSRNMLWNGAASAMPDAPKEYLEAQEHAKSRKLGIWSQ